MTPCFSWKVLTGIILAIYEQKGKTVRPMRNKSRSNDKRRRKKHKVNVDPSSACPPGCGCYFCTRRERPPSRKNPPIAIRAFDSRQDRENHRCIEKRSRRPSTWEKHAAAPHSMQIVDDLLENSYGACMIKGSHPASPVGNTIFRKMLCRP